MSKPSNILQKPSPKTLMLRQKSKKKLMMFPNDEHLNNEGYHGGESASIPFEWESQPGTPKVIRIRENSLPPLTPPPSYYQNVPTTPKLNAKKNSPKSHLLKAIFPKRATSNKGRVLPPPESPNSLSYSSSSSSSSSSPRPKSYSVPSSPMIHSRSGEDEDLYDVPRLSLCFGNARWNSSMFKKVLLGEFM